MYLGTILDDTLSQTIAGIFILIFGSIATLVATFLKNRKKEKNLKDLSLYGLEDVGMQAMSEQEMSHICQRADTIKILYCAGYMFLKKYEGQLKNALNRKNPAKIQYLLSSQNTEFLSEIQDIEMEFGIRNDEAENEINDDVRNAINEIEVIDPGKKIEIGQFKTLYRLPVIIAERYHGDNVHITAWTQVSLPPNKTKRCILLKGSVTKPSDTTLATKEQEETLASMAQHYFDAMWKRATKIDRNSPPDLEEK